MCMMSTWRECDHVHDVHLEFYHVMSTWRECDHVMEGV